MGQRKPSERAKKLVWRISDTAPLGEFVDSRGAAEASSEPKERAGGWVMSSFELLHGAEVNENPDTVPDDLFDELFAPREDAPNASGHE